MITSQEPLLVLYSNIFLVYGITAKKKQWNELYTYFYKYIFL